MAPRHPCYRHARTAWIAGCPDCRAWHASTIAEQRALTEETAEETETATAPSDERQAATVAA
jgi:predicted anti-sigma-YlaC factor YlaD